MAADRSCTTVAYLCMLPVMQHQTVRVFQLQHTPSRSSLDGGAQASTVCSSSLVDSDWVPQVVDDTKADKVKKFLQVSEPSWDYMYVPACCDPF